LKSSPLSQPAPSKNTIQGRASGRGRFISPGDCPMNALIVAGLLLVLLGIAYQSGWSRSRGLVTAHGVKIHSRPQYHGSFVAIWAMVPALVLLGLWAWFGGGVTRDYTVSLMPADIVLSLDQTGLNAAIARIQALASGYGVTGESLTWEQA